MTGVARAGSASHVGNVRRRNEDSVLASSRVFAVADGLGGHAGGDVASSLAIAELAGLDPGSAGPGVRSADVVRAIGRANERILAAVRADPALTGMGTTLSGACLGDNDASPSWILFNVGDSRTYRFQRGVLRQLSVDHSEVEELVAAGRISRDQARTHPLRHIITRSLGSVPAPAADVSVCPAAVDDCLLICTDGLTDELRDEEIAEVLRATSGPQAAADRLVECALEAGGHDNVSVVVVRLQ